ncbi:succinate dehydrogenase assembly factor 2 [Paracoccaceae bacterium]|nr:succinate dehydrogenase assembly factor 2 [Paracoccaceae bacterium]
MEIDNVRKKLLIRSWRRGTKELDLILGGFSNNNVSKFEMAELDLYERLLSNDDYVIYNWLFGKEESPKIFYSLIKQIKEGMYR